METHKKGRLIIVSGPSGVGKGTLVKKLIKKCNNMVLSVSWTTRLPRQGEKNGVHYYFVPYEEFVDIIKKDGFLEFANYNSNYYGTPNKIVYDQINKGKDVILEIDVQGAFKAKKKYSNAIMIFIIPPCVKDLYYRLGKRNTETKEDIEKRIQRAKDEIELSSKYDYIIVNDKINKAINEICDILKC